MHAGTESLPRGVTVGELRDWFAVSVSRRLAVIADDGRYAASLTPADIAADAVADRLAIEIARERPTLAPDTPALTGRDVVSCSQPMRAAFPSLKATDVCTVFSPSPRT